MSARLLTDSSVGLQEAVRLLQAGGVLAFPTDTIYGVGAHAFQPAAVARLYAIKGRPWDRPIPLLLADPADVERLVRAGHVPAAAWRLMAAFWPGALTIVLPRSALVPDVVTSGGDTVALRVPDHALARQLIALVGAPLATTSANLSGDVEPTTAAEVVQSLGPGVDAILAERGRCPGGAPSTVVAVSHGELSVLRVGPISRADLLAAL